MPLIRKILAPESHCEIIAGYHCGIVAINSTVTFLLLKGKAKQIELPSGVENYDLDWSKFQCFTFMVISSLLKLAMKRKCSTLLVG